MTYGKRIHLDTLPSDWQQPIAMMKTLGIPAKGIRGFAAHCGAHGIAFPEATDSRLDDYLAARQLTGELTARSATAYRNDIVASLRGLKELVPDAPATLIFTDSTYALRQKQFEGLTPSLQHEFDKLTKTVWSRRKTTTVLAEKNTLLRSLEMLEKAGTKVSSLIELTSSSTLDRLEELNYGVDQAGLSNARESFLSLAKDIALMKKDGVRLAEISEFMKASENPDGGFSRAKLEAILRLDQKAQGALLMQAQTTLALSGFSPWVNWRDGQAAISIVLAWITSQKVGNVSSAQFVLSFDPALDDNALSAMFVRGRQVPLSKNFMGPIATFRRRHADRWPSGCNDIFLTNAGTRRASCYVSSMATNLAAEVEVATNLEAIAGASVLAMLRAKVHPTAVQKHLGIVQERNFWRRYWQIVELCDHDEFKSLVAKWKERVA